MGATRDAPIIMLATSNGVEAAAGSAASYPYSSKGTDRQNSGNGRPCESLTTDWIRAKKKLALRCGAAGRPFAAQVLPHLCQIHFNACLLLKKRRQHKTKRTLSRAQMVRTSRELLIRRFQRCKY